MPELNNNKHVGVSLAVDGDDLVLSVTPASIDAATAEQGELADTAVQPGDLATVATTGAYSDLSGIPTLGTAAAQNTSAFATAAQGSLAGTALQPGDELTDLASTGVTSGYVPKADGNGGISWAAETGGGGGGSVAWGDISGTLSNQSDLSSALGGKANSSHVHAASDVTSGTFDAARIPNLAASKITSGTFDIALIPTGTSGSTVSLGNHNHSLDSLSNVTITSNSTGELLKWNGSAWVNNTLSEAGVAATSHVHAAGDVTSGTFDSARIPDLNTSKLTAGTLGVTRGGTGLSSLTASNYIRAASSSTFEQRTPAQVLADIGAQPAYIGLNSQSGSSYTLVLSDVNKLITMSNGSANTLTVPTNSSVAFPVGTIVNFAQTGAGVTTVTGASGVTVNGVSAGSAAVTKRYSISSLVKIAANSWLLTGAVEDVD